MSFSYEAASQIAQQLNCDPAAVMAVAEVESGGRKDLADGRPQILFEAHIFDQKTKGRYRAAYPNLSSPVWNRSLYVGGAGEWRRLEAAMRLDEGAALESASWGLFQIMGFNYRAAGFPTVQAFVAAIKGDDNADMKAFMNFVRANPRMLQALRDKDWRTFAATYNGPGAVASYSGKMEEAYRRYALMPTMTDPTGPPIPYADPSGPQSVMSSKTVITGGIGLASGASGLATLADQASMVSSISGSATNTAWSIGGLLKMIQNPLVIVIILLGVALACMVFMLWRYIRKAKVGDVIVR